MVRLEVILPPDFFFLLLFGTAHTTSPLTDGSEATAGPLVQTAAQLVCLRGRLLTSVPPFHHPTRVSSHRYTYETGFQRAAPIS